MNPVSENLLIISFKFREEGKIHKHTHTHKTVGNPFLKFKARVQNGSSALFRYIDFDLKIVSLIILMILFHSLGYFSNVKFFFFFFHFTFENIKIKHNLQS